MTKQIEAVNISEGLGLLDNGEVVPICSMIDCEGEITMSPQHCVAFVLGPCADDKWYDGFRGDYQFSYSH